ncbi:MAG TPA: short-chain dehydrogenase, partial [Planctomycetaceae bacterium]|nr:short-chain dehydrogenase [Planctomycetaceae bacterium]
MNSTPEPTIQQLFDLSGKTVLISGASGYLGSAMARGLAEAGARLVISSRNAERAQQAASELP